jgi:outer membrane protein assembly factor BamB
LSHPSEFRITEFLTMKTILTTISILQALCLLSPGQARAGGGDWPEWRGPTRTGYVSPGAPAPSALPAELKPVWKFKIGPGHSSPVVAEGKLVYLDEQDRQEVIHVVEAGSGRELWRQPFSASFGDEWGSGPRSTPFIDGDRVYAQSCRGEFVCFHLADGKPLWRTSFERDFGVHFLGSQANSGTATRRGNNGSGVIDGDRLVLPVGNTSGASLVCFNKLDGTILWKSGSDEAAYSSFMVATLAGVKQVVALTADALLGAKIEDGTLLWRVPLKTAAKRHAATPVIMGNRVVANSHTFGMVCLEISGDSGGLTARPAWKNEVLKINLATPVLVRGQLYCQGPNRDYVCVDAATGRIRWTQAGFGNGKRDYSSTMVLGDKLLVLTEDGQLILLKANPDRYEELGRLQVCGNTWSFPAYVDGKIYVRDGRQLVCLDLSSS